MAALAPGRAAGSADAAPSVIPSAVRACDDIAEFPPYVFFRREDGRPTGDVAGFAVDLLGAILAKTGRTMQIELVPWRRCLDQVARGVEDVVLSASRSPERERSFIFTRPYSTLTTILIFDRSLPSPAGSLAALARIRLCGQFGYQYPGLAGMTLQQTAKSFEGVLGMLRAGRCDAMVASPQVVAGHSLILGHDAVDAAQFGIVPLADATPVPVAMMVSRALPSAEALAGAIDDGIAELERSGEAERLRQHYGLTTP